MFTVFLILSFLYDKNNEKKNFRNQIFIFNFKMNEKMYLEKNNEIELLQPLFKVPVTK